METNNFGLHIFENTISLKIALNITNYNII